MRCRGSILESRVFTVDYYFIYERHPLRISADIGRPELSHCFPQTFKPKPRIIP